MQIQWVNIYSYIALARERQGMPKRVCFKDYITYLSENDTGKSRFYMSCIFLTKTWLFDTMLTCEAESIHSEMCRQSLVNN